MRFPCQLKPNLAKLEQDDSMARLNIQLDSDDELPELSTILASRIKGAITNTPKKPEQEPVENPFDKEETPRALTDVSSNTSRPSKQQPTLRPKQAYVKSSFLPTSDSSISDLEGGYDHSEKAFDSVSIGVDSGRLSKGAADYTRQAQVSANIREAVHHDDCSHADLSDFVVPDSASDTEVLASRSPKKKKSRSPKKILPARLQEPGLPLCGQPLTNIRQPFRTSDFILPEKKDRSETCEEFPPSDKPFRPEPVDAHSNLDDRFAL